jgi:hypothetical protein
MKHVDRGRVSIMERPEITGPTHESIAKRHDWLWSRFIRGVGDKPQAKLLVFEGDSDSGYRAEHNEIHIVLGGWDLDEVPTPKDVPGEPSSPPPLGWPIWEQHLYHEFVHEYQDKVICGHVGEEGVALGNDPTIQRFSGWGHDATYYTAAAAIARILGFDVREFVNSL